MYLLVYNALSCVCWTAVLAYTVQAWLRGHTPGKLYEDVHEVLQIAQTAAVLEVAHAAARLVRSPLATTAQQVASRIFVVWGILWAVPGVAAKSLVLGRIRDTEIALNMYSLLIAWGVTEVIRYSFYAFKQVGEAPAVLTWLRYTTFIVLYPLGVSSELAMVWLALPLIRKRGIGHYPMPNALNMSFSWYWVCIAIAMFYVPGFPPIYMYMFKQRRKVLGAPAVGKKRQ